MFSRYADPETLINNRLACGAFYPFMGCLAKTIIKERDDNRLWELWLHKVFDKQSFDQFRTEVTGDAN